MLLRKIIILLFSFLIFTATVTAQQNIPVKRFPVKNIGYEDGLSDNNMNSVVTDADGFTWVSTFTGLQRYNGYKLQTINPVIGNDTFNINYPVYLFALNNGNILISIKNGVIEYDTHTNQFKLLINLQIKVSFHFSIVPLKETPQGCLWCMQQDKGIVLYSKDGILLKTFSFFKNDVIDEILHTDNILFGVIVACAGDFIYINNQKNILCIDAKSETSNIIAVPATDLFLATAAWHDKLFLAEKKQLIVIDKNGTGDRHIIQMNTADAITGSSLKEYNGNIYLGRNGHLYNLDTSGNIEYELTNRDKKEFVANGNIQKIYPDKFNRIWIVSNNDIKRIENKELLFQNFSYPGNQSNFVRALYFDTTKNILLAGGYNGIIQAYDTSANPIWQRPVVTKLGEYILSIEKLSGDVYLIIPFYAEPFLFNIKTKATSFLAEGVPGFKNMLANFANNLQRINDSTVLIADNTTIYKCIFKKEKLLSATPLINCISDKKLSCFFYNSNKELWFGTTSSLLYVIRNTKADSVSLPNHYAVRSITEDSLHQVYVGTEKGLFIYNSNMKLIKNFNTTSGLRNDCIYAIMPTSNGCFVSTNVGISSIASDGTIHNYSKEMGLQENEFNTNAVLKMKSGKILFGGVNGITAFYPETLTQTKDKPQIHIIQITVDDVPQSSASGIWFANSIKLNYKQNRLRFDIAAMGMLNVNEYVYQYRLTDFDTTWQTTYQPTNINYVLQPGNYTLEIKCHPLLSANEVFTKNFSITITPPYWQTWWFRAIVFACIVAVIYFSVYRYNRSKYLRKIRLLETQQQIQTERERISRELHDNIGSQLSFIISNIDWTIDSSERMTKAEEMQRLAAINDTAKNVMSNLRESIWALNKEKITLEEFADKLKHYIQNIIELKPGLELVSKENIRSNISFSPTETLNLFRICQEVINNIIKHAQATLIKIYISSDENKFSILIEDNGKGFDVHEQLNGHYGLQNMQYRAHELNLTISIQSEEGIGTTVLIN